MKGRRHTREQIVRKLHEADRLVAEGKSMAVVLKQLGVSEQTYYRLRKAYGSPSPDEAPSRARTGEPPAEEAGRRQGARARRAEGDRPGKLLSPERRRRATVMAQDRFGLSERRACRVVSQPRSTQRRTAPAPGDCPLRARLHEIARRHQRFGYRRAHAILVREGWILNRKKVLRLWREEGLKVHPRHHKRRRPAGGEQVQRAERPNHVWAIDFQFDATSDGRMLKLANVVDEFTREALSTRTARRFYSCRCLKKSF